MTFFFKECAKEYCLDEYSGQLKEIPALAKKFCSKKFCDRYYLTGETSIFWVFLRIGIGGRTKMLWCKGPKSRVFIG